MTAGQKLLALAQTLLTQEAEHGDTQLPPEDGGQLLVMRANLPGDV